MCKVIDSLTALCKVLVIVDSLTALCKVLVIVDSLTTLCKVLVIVDSLTALCKVLVIVDSLTLLCSTCSIKKKKIPLPGHDFRVTHLLYCLPRFQWMKIKCPEPWDRKLCVLKMLNKVLIPVVVCVHVHACVCV